MRGIRSFVRREGRFTPAQRRAFTAHWDRYGVDEPAQLADLDRLFGRCAPHILEIGCGNGACIAELAQRHPECDFLGVEVYRPGLGRLMNRLAAEQTANVRLLAGDIQDVINTIGAAALTAVCMFFPDPWPKLRHQKRRLLQAPFVADLARVTRAGGRLYLATDDGGYADQMRQICTAGGFVNIAPANSNSIRLRSRPITRYEARALQAGRAIHDMVFLSAAR